MQLCYPPADPQQNNTDPCDEPLSTKREHEQQHRVPAPPFLLPAPLPNEALLPQINTESRHPATVIFIRPFLLLEQHPLKPSVSATFHQAGLTLY